MSNLSVVSSNNHAHTSTVQTNSKSKIDWCNVGGGAMVGLINALAHGIIFGPIAAALAFFLTSIGSFCLASVVAKRNQIVVANDLQIVGDSNSIAIDKKTDESLKITEDIVKSFGGTNGR